MLIGQAGSIGGAKRTGVFWEAGSSLGSSAQITKEARCELPAEKGTEPCG